MRTEENVVDLHIYIGQHSTYSRDYSENDEDNTDYEIALARADDFFFVFAWTTGRKTL